MASLLYTADLDPKYAGRPVRIYDATGTEVDGSPFTLDSNGDYTYTATAAGHYTAKVDNPAVYAGDGVSVVDLTIDVPASIAAASGGGVGAAETAYFVATTPTVATDAYDTVDIEWVADARHGDLPAWASVVSGDIALTTDAGTCAWSFAGQTDFDFSATTPPGSGGNISTSYAIRLDGNQIATSGNIFQPGDGQDSQETEIGRLGGATAGALFSATHSPSADSDGSTGIADGTAISKVAFTVTRIAQAAVLPA